MDFGRLDSSAEPSDGVHTCARTEAADLGKYEEVVNREEGASVPGEHDGDLKGRVDS